MRNKMKSIWYELQKFRCIVIVVLAAISACNFMSGCAAKNNMPIPDRVLLSVSGGVVGDNYEELTLNKDRIVLSVVGNSKSFNDQLDSDIGKKLTKLLAAYGYNLGSLEEADYVVSYAYQVKSSGNMWEASSGYAPENWKALGWFQNKIKGLHRYQLSLSLFVVPAKDFKDAALNWKAVSARSGIWFVDVKGMVRTNNFAKPIDFGLVGGMRLFGRALLSYDDGPRIFSTDEDFKLVSSNDDYNIVLKQKSAGESIVPIDSYILWDKFDKFLTSAGVKVYEKNRERGFLKTSYITFGTLSAKGIIDDRLNHMFEHLPEIEDGTYSPPSGYYISVRVKSIGDEKTLSKIQVKANARSDNNKDQMRLISSDYAEPRLIDYVKSQVR